MVRRVTSGEIGFVIRIFIFGIAIKFLNDFFSQTFGNTNLDPQTNLIIGIVLIVIIAYFFDLPKNRLL